MNSTLTVKSTKLTEDIVCSEYRRWNEHYAESKRQQNDLGDTHVVMALDVSGSLISAYGMYNCDWLVDSIQNVNTALSRATALPWVTFNHVEPQRYEAMERGDTFTVYGGGGSALVPTLEWVADQAGYTVANGEFVHKDGTAGVSGRPTCAVIVTDGQVLDVDGAAELLHHMSELPIFVQFVGIGMSDYPELELLEHSSATSSLLQNVAQIPLSRNHVDLTQQIVDTYRRYLLQANAAGLTRW